MTKRVNWNARRVAVVVCSFLTVSAMFVLLCIRPQATDPWGFVGVDRLAVWGSFGLFSGMALLTVGMVAFLTESSSGRGLIPAGVIRVFGVFLTVSAVIWAGVLFWFSLFGGVSVYGGTLALAVAAPPLTLGVGVMSIGIATHRRRLVLIPILACLALGAAMTQLTLRGY